MLAAADAETKMIVLLLLSGVRVDEIPALHWRDIDPTANRIRIAGDSPRDVVVNPSLQTMLYAQSGHPADAPLIEPSPRDSIDARILCAAHDAAIADAAEINAECIRHTYIAFLVRSQLRFADLARIVGPLSPELLRAYSLLSPSGARLGLDAVDATHPAAREHAVKER